MRPDVARLEQVHHALYAPSFLISVNGQNLVSQHFLEIASVQVDTTLEGADRFTFTVNGTFDVERREFTHLDLFAFGSAVEIRFGYQDLSPKKLALVHRGIITAVQTSFPSSGLPQINVSGYDLSHCMRKCRRWEESSDNKKDSEIAAAVAEKYGLECMAEDSEVVHPKTERGQDSDFAFLEKLAERCGFELFVFDRTLFFRPPSQDEAVLTLEWGKGLVSFTPEVNVAAQVSKVEVRGWDVAQKQEVVGTATQGDEPGRDPGERSGAEHVTSVCRDGVELKIRRPPLSQSEADQLAKAILKDRAETFVTGSGESIGLPEILPDRRIELLGLGARFSGIYYVQQTTHTISTSGYRTTFKVKDTTI